MSWQHPLGSNAYALGAALVIFLTMVVPTIDMVRHRWVRARTILRRKIDLPAGATFLTPADTEEAVDVALEAFNGIAGTHAPDGFFDWMMGPQLHGKQDDPRRIFLLRWLLRFFLVLLQMTPGHEVLGVRTSDGRLVAIASVTPYLGA